MTGVSDSSPSVAVVRYSLASNGWVATCDECRVVFGPWERQEQAQEFTDAHACPTPRGPFGHLVGMDEASPSASYEARP